MVPRSFAPARRRFLLMRAPATGCLALAGTVCRSCAEQCAPRAITFRLLRAGRALPLFDEARCDGCGDCARACPAGAIALDTP